MKRLKTMTRQSRRDAIWNPAVVALTLVTMLLSTTGIAVPLGENPIVADECAPNDNAGESQQEAVELDTPTVCDARLSPDDTADWYALLHRTPNNLAPGDLRLVVAMTVEDDLEAQVCLYRGSFQAECADADAANPGTIVTTVRPTYTQHYLQVHRLDGQGAYTLDVALSAWTGTASCLAPGALAPANDCFHYATEVTAPTTLDQPMDGTTIQAGEPTCDDNAVDRSVWYRFTPEVTGPQWVFAGGKAPAVAHANHFGVYTGESLQSLEEVACVQGANPDPLTWTAQQGTTYHIRVGVSGNPEDLEFRLVDRADVCFPVEGVVDVLDVPNDCFLDAVALTVPSQGTYNTLGATLQPWEPDWGHWHWGRGSLWDQIVPGDGYPVRIGPSSAWYEFTPEEGRGRYRVTAISDDYSPGVAVYRGDELSSLHQFGRAYLGFQGTYPVTVDVFAGGMYSWVGSPDVPYQMQVAPFMPHLLAYAPNAGVGKGLIIPFVKDGGTLELTLEGGPVPCSEGPVNHCFENAIPVTSPVRIEGDNTGAGMEVDEPRCGGEDGPGEWATMWYRYTADEDVSMWIDRFEMYEPGWMKSTVSVFEGTSLGTLVPLNEWPHDRAECETRDDMLVHWNAEAGKTYWIQFGGRFVSLATEGPFVMELVKGNGECRSGPPPNDCVIDAEPIARDESLSGSNVGATSQPGEARPKWPSFEGPCGMNYATVWYHFTPTDSGPITVSTEGSDFDTVLQVSKNKWDTGGSVNQECNDDADDENVHSNITFHVEAGHEYWIRVGGAVKADGDGEGDIVITLN